MAELDYGRDASPQGDFSDIEPPIGIFSRALSYVGALSSIALVVGLGVWGYELTMRDVTDVPVIRALEGPSRIQPEDPGGQLAQHTGLAVNSVQSQGEAAGPAPEVILAPDPIDLRTDDIVLAAPEEGEVRPDELAEAIGTVVSLTLEEQGLTPQERGARVNERLEDSAGPDVISNTIPGVKRSQRPALRPAINLQNLQQTSAATSASGGIISLDVDPASIPTGTRLVQLGAFDDLETARAEWDKIAVNFSDYMDNKQRVILKAKSGERTFYRLRALGFDDLNASRRFCAVLVAADAACIPILSR
ncbi:MAG: SPOR domain-containing protein [Pseudomonadota bacterium]